MNHICTGPVCPSWDRCEHLEVKERFGTIPAKEMVPALLEKASAIDEAIARLDYFSSHREELEANRRAMRRGTRRFKRIIRRAYGRKAMAIFDYSMFSDAMDALHAVIGAEQIPERLFAPVEKSLRWYVGTFAGPIIQAIKERRPMNIMEMISQAMSRSMS